ncbi:hypothetical protein ABT304_21125 [Nocardioides sp. NPDC000445]|uniref:glycosyltransferase n=1 Tax=Nocardioides sp. NPDC000445 TaxID=3154257 RepID=UPI00331EAD07
MRTISSLLTADRNLITEMPWELEGFTLPEGFERVGPIFAHIEAPMPSIVEELATASRPLVYLGLGSSASRRIAVAAAHALGTLPVNVIAPISHYLGAGETLPPNVHVTGLLPAHRLGGLVDAAVLHGGQGTVQTACATGIPFVGMGLQPEQTWHVRMCETARQRDRGIAEARRVTRVRRRRTPRPRRSGHPRRRLGGAAGVRRSGRCRSIRPDHRSGAMSRRANSGRHAAPEVRALWKDGRGIPASVAR